ncbi:ATP-dependent helicase [Ornithinimicrobium sp. Y1847]|uniref:ATP-dependent helicase n=1 Tax=unclassified Ornithinimicrobium TaxID=2615080 RepID=UPI003B67739A
MPSLTGTSSARSAADPDQAQVISHRGGVLVVLGAPGTGRTTAATRHVQGRILDDGLSPDQCLVLAPTRVSADRLRTRIGAGLGSTFTRPAARTPSSLAFAVLRRAAAASGEVLPRLLSGAEQDVVLKELLDGHREQGVGPAWPEHLRAALSTAGFRAQLRDLLMRSVEHGLEPTDLAELGRAHGRPEWVAAADVLMEYDQVTALSEPGGYDPAWICTAAADLLEDDPDLRALVQRGLQVLVVDDAQELTASAARLLRVLHPAGADAVLVGDPDATVLGFRGAVPGRFVSLADELAADARAQATTVVLGSRHRGGPALAGVQGRVASRIGVVGAAGAGHRQPGVTREDAPTPVSVGIARSRSQEAEHVAQWLRVAHLREQVPWEQMAVLARSGAQQEVIRRTFAARGVPVHLPGGGLPLAQEPATTPLILAFDVVTREHRADDGTFSGVAAPVLTITPEEVLQLLTSPLGGVDPVALRRLRRRLRATELLEGDGRGVDEVLTALVSGAAPELRGSSGAEQEPELAPVARLARILDAGRQAHDRAGTAQDILWALWDASGLAQVWEAQALAGGALGLRADRDLDAVLVLFGRAETFVDRLPGARPRSLLDQLRDAEVAADTLVAGARREQVVEVLTPQAAAGREWRRVAVVGVQDGVWPDLRLRDSLLGAETLVAALRGHPVAGPQAVRAAQAQVRADELRQFYVALSRASEALLVTAVGSTDEQPSSFVDLVDPDHRSRPPVDVPAPVTLRGLVGTLRRAAVQGQRDLRFDERDVAVDHLRVLAAEGVAGADPRLWWDARAVSTDEDLVPVGPVRVSPSRVQTFLDCQLRWFLTTHGAEDGDSASAEIGTLVHDIVATAPDGDAGSLAEELERRWPELGLRASWVSERQLARAREMLSRYAAYVADVSAEGRTLLGTEVGLRALVPAEEDGGRDVLLTGQVDRLERDPAGRLVVADLKTSRSKPTREEIRTHAQLGAYQVAVEQGAFEQHPASGSGGAALVHLGRSEKEIAQSQGPIGDADDPRWAHRMVSEAGSGMSGHSFTAQDMGQSCRRCPARFCCPIQPEGQQR